MKLKKTILVAFITLIMLAPLGVQASGVLTSYGTAKTPPGPTVYCYAWTGAHGGYARIAEFMYDKYSGQYLGLLTPSRTVYQNSYGNAWAQTPQEIYNGDALTEKSYHSTDVQYAYSS